MNATAQAQSVEVLSHRDNGAIVGVDLAKLVFQLCVADRRWQARK